MGFSRKGIVPVLSRQIKPIDEVSNEQTLDEAHSSQISEKLSNASEQSLQCEARSTQDADGLFREQMIYEAQLRQQEDELSNARAQLAIYQAQLEQHAAIIAEAQSKLLKKEEVLRWIRSSRSWQIASSLRRLQQRSHQFREFSHKVLRRLHLPGQGVFHGAIDAPGKTGRVSPYLNVVGWVFSTASPVKSVEARLDSLPLGELQYGQARPDVAATFTGQVPTDCGYTGQFMIDKSLTGRRVLMIRVEDEQGNIEDYTRTVLIEESDEHTASGDVMATVEKVGEAHESFTNLFLQNDLSVSKKFLTSEARISLESFLSSDSTIEFPECKRPELSITLILYNRAELTLQCLYSILRSNLDSFEVIIVDNASTDETGLLLKRIKGARIIKNETNIHYLLGCNQAAREAEGKYLLLLNNDTQILANSLSSALETFKSSNDIGAVGGKIILPDGTLQEAGCIIWQDGSCLGYGRGDSPFAPAYMFKRDVDYCSAAFLLTRRDLFLEDGGFDEDYVPAYYEETDYCVRLWKKGKRVVYDPNVIVLHHEFASSVSEQSAINMAIMNQPTFVAKNEDWLRFQHLPSRENILAARTSGRRGGQRILFIDDRIPHVSLGVDFPNRNRILSEMVESGRFVTLYPLKQRQEDWCRIYQDIPREVEVIADHDLHRLEEFLEQRSDYYDLIFISSSHKIAALRPLLKNPQLNRKAKVVCDAQELSFLWSARQLRSKESISIESSKARSSVRRSA